ncbi:unnamed protein product [Sphenostylis stenocarpa]|uniref:Mediator of RNA polymerase II transcription subunit 19a n=1 Tax=Sphenostylis stenocarpa TaxID=92480 RepID=A0AA86T227_9FABA|nr:unnamed protein product [Sphenostylis stenocarpa]
MDLDCKKFRGGPRELTGAMDLLNHFKLLPHFEFFCKRQLPVSISDAHYLHNIVGDREIRKEDGMQLDQLLQNTSLPSDTNYCIQPLDLDILKEAFQLKQTVPVDLPAAEKGILTVAGKSKGETKDEEKKHRKHKDKDKGHRKHKLRQKDQSKDKEKDKKKDKSRHHDFSAFGADPSKKHHDKHKSTKFDELGAVKVAG